MNERIYILFLEMKTPKERLGKMPSSQGTMFPRD